MPGKQNLKIPGVAVREPNSIVSPTSDALDTTPRHPNALTLSVRAVELDSLALGRVKVQGPASAVSAAAAMAAPVQTAAAA